MSGNEHLTWTNARLLRALFEGGQVNAEMAKKASDILLKDQDSVFLDEGPFGKGSSAGAEVDGGSSTSATRTRSTPRLVVARESLGFPNKDNSELVNTNPEDNSNNPHLFDDRVPVDVIRNNMEHILDDPLEPNQDQGLFLDPAIAEEAQRKDEAIAAATASDYRSTKQYLGKAMKVVSGIYKQSDYDSNIVYLFFRVGKTVLPPKLYATAANQPSILVGNGTAWVLQFTASRSRFTVLDIFSMGEDWVVGPERDPTGGSQFSSINYVGFAYQQLFRLVTQANDEFADEGPAGY